MLRAVSWTEYETMADKLANELKGNHIDLIIGIARGGLPLSVSLSHKLNCRDIGVILVTKTQSEAKFDYSDTYWMSEVIVTNRQCRNVLIVDDILSIGDVFTGVRNLLVEAFPDITNYTYASLFADTIAIKKGEFSTVLQDLLFVEDIDNSEVWIEFPWEKSNDHSFVDRPA